MNELERQKLDALKELAYGASHEINNPLANIAARAQTLLRDEAHPERRRALEAIHQQALRAHEMISDLMLFARPPELVLESVDLNELIRLVVKSLADESADRQIEFILRLPENAVQIVGDAEQLTVALKAVCVNALEAVGCAGTVTIVVSRENLVGVERAVIEIADTGPGISAEIREHIFDPFFSGREAGRGLGFGLSKCWRIVTEHGGEIVVASVATQGTTFTIHLPSKFSPPQPLSRIAMQSTDEHG
ncbi:MAG: HAMP domain-containing sensor histidine kinase [Bythopirellula sp.]|nr:HAMP domain-containing sensor histidine kinase [Bythopirellula sp.]